MKKSFILYKDQRTVFEILSPRECKELLLAIFDFASGIDKPLTSKVKIAFISIKNQLQRDLDKWEANSEMRKQFGRKGGLAKASLSLPKASKSLAKLSKPAVNVNVNDNKRNIKEKIQSIQQAGKKEFEDEAWAAANEATELYNKRRRP